MTKYWLLILVCCASIAPAWSQNDSAAYITIAVSPFEVTGKVPDTEWMGESFADAVVGRLAASPQLRVVERSFLTQIFKELALHMTGAVEESTVVEAGHILGASVMVAGRVNVANDMAEVTSRVVRVESGEVLGMVHAAGPAGQATDLMRQIADGIYAKLSLRSPAVPGKTGLTTVVSNALQRKLDRCARLVEGLPLVGLDPARKRKQTEYDNGITQAEGIIAEQPRFMPGHYYKAVFSFQSDDLQAAQEECALAKELDPGDIRPLLLEANMAFSGQDLAQAQACFQQAVSVFPYDSRGWYGLGRTQLKQQRKKEALGAFIDAVRLTPVVPEAFTNLQTLLGSPAAVPLCEELRTANDRHYPAAAVFFLYFKQPREFRPDLVSLALAAFPDLFMVRYAQGCLAAQQGDVGQAQLQLEQCIALYPSFPDAHRELGILFLKQKKCVLGKDHIKAYAAVANEIADCQELESMMQKCSQ